MVLFYISGISLVFKWTTQHWYTIISASSHQVNVMLKITQTMPLWNIHHRFCNLNLFCIRIEIWRMKEKKYEGKINENECPLTAYSKANSRWIYEIRSWTYRMWLWDWNTNCAGNQADSNHHENGNNRPNFHFSEFFTLFLKFDDKKKTESPSLNWEKVSLNPVFSLSSWI